MQPATEGNPQRHFNVNTLQSSFAIFNNIFIMQMCVYIYKLYTV